MLHGEIPRLWTYTHSSFSLFSRASFLSIFHFISLSLSLSSCPFSLFLSLSPLSFSFLLYIISFRSLVQFISIPLRCLPSPFPSSVWYRILFYSWTRIMSAWPLPLAKPLRFPRVPSCDSPSHSLPFLFRKANKVRVDGILCWLRS